MAKDDATRTRRVRSLDALDKLLCEVESGAAPKPEWIELRGECRIERLDAERLAPLVRRIHGAVRRGFRPRKQKLTGARRLALWRSLAQNGFHDFSELGWTKCWDSPIVENYDYVGPYLEGGLDALDAFDVYAAVLGTHDYGVEDFVATKLCANVGTIIEPMAGSAEFAYNGHFRFPELRYLMFDLDPAARDHVQAKHWLPDTERHYLLGNVLDEGIWKEIQRLSDGPTLSYIGKQSHHFLTAPELYHLLDVGTRYVDYFMLEVPEPSLMNDLDEEEDLTRTEMMDAGFSAGLIDVANTKPNPLTNHMSFALEIWDEKNRRRLFGYEDWTSWQAPTLVALATLLELRCWFFHADEEQFWPVEEGARAGAAADNVNFLIFTRHPGES
jgi:hypothetical protein